VESNIKLDRLPGFTSLRKSVQERLPYVIDDFKLDILRMKRGSPAKLAAQLNVSVATISNDASLLKALVKTIRDNETVQFSENKGHGFERLIKDHVSWEELTCEVPAEENLEASTVEILTQDAPIIELTGDQSLSSQLQKIATQVGELEELEKELKDLQSLLAEAQALVLDIATSPTSKLSALLQSLGELLDVEDFGNSALEGSDTSVEDDGVDQLPATKYEVLRNTLPDTAGEAWDNKKIIAEKTFLRSLSKFTKLDQDLITAAVNDLMNLGYNTTVASQKHNKYNVSSSNPLKGKTKSRASKAIRYFWHVTDDAILLSDVKRRAEVGSEA